MFVDHTEGIDSVSQRSHFLPSTSSAGSDTVSLNEPLSSRRYHDNTATSPDVYELYSKVVRIENKRPFDGSRERLVEQRYCVSHTEVIACDVFGSNYQITGR